MQSSIQSVYEDVLDEVLTSWTALDLAGGQYDGQLREAREKRQVLLEAISDAVREDKYEVQDIAEFINEYMYEQFFMELDDESHFGVAKVCLDAWNMCKNGQRPHMIKQTSGSSCSVIKDVSEEVDQDADMEDSHMEDDSEQSQSANRPHVVTDEDGWSTIVPKSNRH
jgi:hypothetical protein